MTFYQILEVSPDASVEEIKASYRRLVKSYHPDVNPSPQAAEVIRLLTESYDVLSNDYRRRMYDLTLGGVAQPHIPVQETEEERYRREFRQKRKEEQRIKSERQFRQKLKFYQFQRWSQVFFLAIGVLFSIDYYLLSEPIDEQVVNIREGRLDGSKVQLENHRFISEDRLFLDHLKTPITDIQVVHSSVFGIPTRLVTQDKQGKQHQYRIYRNLHDLNNIFPLLLIAIGIVILFKRHYADWALTLGIIPFFLGGFLLMSIVVLW
ncbi:MAG: J domain-containing protein [Cytophagales bacterium]|nr:J domain-containing protein [Cytophagales bacterium]